VVTQEVVFATENPEPERLLTLSKTTTSDSAQVYTVQTSRHVAAPGRMLLYKEERGARTLVESAGRLLTMDITKLGDSWQVKGAWAAYADPSGTAARHGWISGHVEWSGDLDAPMWLYLRMTSDTDPEIWEETCFAAPDRERSTDTAFLHAIERSPTMIPLLVNEVLPRDVRNEMPFLRFLPALHESRLVVHTMASPSESMVSEAMGGADDDGWSSLRGRPFGAGAFLRAAHNDRALLVIVDVGVALSASTRLTLCMMPRPSTPVTSSEYLKVELHEDVAATWGTAEARETFGHEITGGIVRESSRWLAHVVIPFDHVAEYPALTRHTVLRLNAAIVDSEDGDRSVATWGWPHLDEIAYGALLVLKPVE
jgi:hypothetical protein